METASSEYQSWKWNPRRRWKTLKTVWIAASIQRDQCNDLAVLVVDVVALLSGARVVAVVASRFPCPSPRMMTFHLDWIVGK